MASSEETPLGNDDAIACAAETYLQDRKNGTAATIESYLERYPHLGGELRDSLEAIDLLLPESLHRAPQVLGDFHIDEEIGRGGIGIVYSAVQSSLQRKVALKVLNSRHGETAFVGGSNPVESLSRLQQNAVEEPRVLMRGLSRDWIAVLEKCTARQPKDRYSSAASLATGWRLQLRNQPDNACCHGS